MAWLSFLKSKDFDPLQFEKELSTLARRISQKERNVSKYNYQVNRIRRGLVVYGVLGYVALLLYVSFTTRLAWRLVSTEQWCSMAIVPIALLSMIKGITALYTMRIERTETSIQLLKDEHSAKIEELKEKTKFSSTQALLNRFADGGDLNAQLDEELQEKQRQLDEIKKLSLEQEENVKTFHAYPNQSRSWLDLAVDSLVGSDELSPQSRYALICPRCLTHNGLAPPGKEASQVKYRCPTCGLVNGLEPSGLEAEKTSPEQAKPLPEENTSDSIEQKENS